LATVGGASVLRRDDLGRLAPGYAADLIAVDLDRIEFAGALHDPVAAAVFCAPGRVAYSWVGGQRLVDNGEVVGVELAEDLVESARANARRNGLENARFAVADLQQGVDDLDWMRRGFDGVLIDPPRSGAIEVLPRVAATGARRIVYVSCDPATLARDAEALVHQHGYRLQAAGIADMFPHTAHVESLALFVRETA